MINSLKILLKRNYFLFKLLRFPLSIFGFFKRKSAAIVDESWRERINVVLESPDNKLIKRVANAGQIEKDIQVMHNGVKIHVGSYYGDGATVLLHRNKGVHEPQEEKVFEQVLSFLPANSTMLELGAFWGFYSMSFQAKIKNARNFLIEPDPHALISGKHNFRLNNFKGIFFNYFVSDENVPGKVPTITVDQFLADNAIPHLSILHSDIQGFELRMLAGAKNSLTNGKIDYIFISTHSNDLHRSCIDYLMNYDYKILCDANIDETYSWDGLIVARHKNISIPESLQISKKH